MDQLTAPVHFDSSWQGFGLNRNMLLNCEIKLSPSRSVRISVFPSLLSACWYERLLFGRWCLPEISLSEKGKKDKESKAICCGIEQWRILPTRCFCGLKEDDLPLLPVRQDAHKVFFLSAPSGNISSRQPPDRGKISQHDTWRATIEWCEALCKTTPLLKAVTF